MELWIQFNQENLYLQSYSTYDNLKNETINKQIMYKNELCFQ